MAKGPTWFKLYVDSLACLFDAVPDEEVGRAMKLALAYFKTGEEPFLETPLTDACFRVLKSAIDESRYDYAQKVEAGKASAEKRKVNREIRLLRNKNAP